MRAQQANIKHGLSDTHEYYTFNRIVDSIANPDSVFYCRYGGRGLTMDPRYDPKYKDQGKVAAFMNFINDLKELKLFPIPKGMTLDRKNNDIGYWKDNLRVVTQQVNNQNRECNVVTAEIVIKIREEYSRGGITQKALGEKYNCHKQVVWDIVNYKSWNNIK